MAANIVLGKTPKTFKKFPVKFKTPEGESAAIAVTFKYRTRAGFSAYLKSMFDIEADEPVEGEKIDFVALFAKGGERTVEKLLDAMDSWDFGHDLNKETLMQLHDEFPAAIAAFGDAYRMACVDGKLGN